MSKDATPTPAVPGAVAMTEANRLYLAFLPGRLRQIRPADDDDLIAAADHIDAQAAELTRLRAQVREGEKVRAEALEEAAKYVESRIDEKHFPASRSEPDEDGISWPIPERSQRRLCDPRALAAAIRALTPQPAPTEGGKG